jgi:hypothetical protein
MAKSKMDSTRLKFSKNPTPASPPDQSVIDENQKWLNSKDFRLKEKMIAADPVVGPDLIWSFDDQPISSFANSTIITGSNYVTVSGSSTSVGQGSFWIPNRVYYSGHDWPMQGTITSGIRVIRFITLFWGGDYCALQPQAITSYPGIDPIRNPIKIFAIDIPTAGKAWLKSNKLSPDTGGDVMIAGHYGPCNWVGAHTPIGVGHHFRFMRYLAPTLTNVNFLDTDVLNILILFNNAFVTQVSATDQFGNIPATSNGIPGVDNSRLKFAPIFDFPCYLPWAGNVGNSNGSPLGNSITEFFGIIGPTPGDLLVRDDPGGHPFFIDTGPATFGSWLENINIDFGTFETGSHGQYFGTGQINPTTQYGLGSVHFEEDLLRFKTAYPKFKRHKTVLFHSCPPPYGIVSGFDTPVSVEGILNTPGMYPGLDQPIIDFYHNEVRSTSAPFDLQVQWSQLALIPLIQNMCDELALYGVTYGGTVNENTTFDDFIPVIQSYLAS